MIDCAIILAAGESRRMGSVASSKVLLPLQHETFLSRHIDLLTAAGLERILVVTSPRLSKFLAPHVSRKGTLVVSPLASEHPGSALSVLSGFESLRREAPRASALIIDGDTVYARSLLRSILDESGKASWLFAIDRTGGDREEVRVYGRPSGEPVLIGKDLPRAAVDELMCFGESLGMISLTAEDVDYASDLIRSLVSSALAVRGQASAVIRLEHEEVWQHLFDSRRLGVRIFTGDLLFAECDTAADYDEVLTVVLPAVRADDST